VGYFSKQWFSPRLMLHSQKMAKIEEYYLSIKMCNALFKKFKDYIFVHNHKHKNLTHDKFIQHGDKLFLQKKQLFAIVASEITKNQQYIWHHMNNITNTELPEFN